MKNLFAKAIEFIREYPSLIYSLVLVIIIPTAFFLNTYLITNNFEGNINNITQMHAVMMEDILKHVVNQHLDDRTQLQAVIEQIRQENDKVSNISIFFPGADRDSFDVAASTDPNLVGQPYENIQTTLAWKQPEGIAFLSEEELGRFWHITKSITNPAGEKVALVSMSFSLYDTDRMIGATINQAYVILVVTILVVILFVSNQARLFGYAMTLSKLKEVDTMKDTFISMASHELRTPLTAIKGYLEFLQDPAMKTDEKDRKHYLENITYSVNRLNNLVEDMLEVSRLEGNRIPIEITSFDPGPLIAQSVEELRSQAVAKQLTLTYQQGPQAAVKADKERFKQVLVNLVGNAIKYTKKGSVTVSAKVKDKEYLLTVADTGIGISSDDKEKLFQKFSRIKNNQTQDINGTGLGLWITLELIRRMNGKITVESIEGVGSHFTVHLPLA